MSKPFGSAALVAIIVALGAVAAASPLSASSSDVQAEAVGETTPSGATGDSVDDMAIWRHPTDPSGSLVIGADHYANTVDVYAMDGDRLQSIKLQDANNVDLRSGFPLAGDVVDLVGVGGGDPGIGRLTFFKVDPASRRLVNVTVGGYYSVPAANGFCMYHDDAGGFYAFRAVPGGVVQQYELFDDGGEVNARPAGEPFDVEPEPIDPNAYDAIEACAVDDAAGSLFIAEQDLGIWKYSAKPGASRTKADRTLVDGTRNGYLKADVEGLTVLAEPGGGGFLIASSQGDSTFIVYRRQAPHEFVRKVTVVGGPGADGCDRTDGIDAMTGDFGADFRRGIFVCQDNTNTDPAPGNMNLKYVPLEAVVPLGGSPPPEPPAPAPEPPAPQESPTAAPPPSPPAAPPGYWMLGSDGTVYAYGGAPQHGDPRPLSSRAVDLERNPPGRGYWVVDRQGTVYAFGDATHHGGLPKAFLHNGEEATSLSATPTGRGYWIFTSRGRVAPFGDARFLGDMSATTLNAPVLDSVATASGSGYYMVAADGGIFSFGDARFLGSMGDTPLNAPVQSLVPDPDQSGYWLVAADGGIFSFAADFRGSMGATPLNRPVTGMVAYGNGYLMVGEDGGIFNFSDQPYSGSLGDQPPTHPIVAVAASR